MQRAGGAVRRADELDIVGLGALNVDLVVSPAGDGGSRLDDNETVATTEDIRARLDAGGLVPRAFLGGSAFNAIAMLAHLETGLRLAMIGVGAARSPHVDRTHAERLAELGIADLTRLSSQRPGLCLALTEKNRRRLYTSPEANVEIADYLRDDERPRQAAAGARVLHLTSLLEDPHLPGTNDVAKAVAGFVEAVKGDNPGLVLSFDPGRTWVDGLGDLADLRRIYALADLLYTSPPEYAALGGRLSNGGFRRVGLAGLCPPGAVVIVKSTDQIVVCDAGGSELARVPREDRAVAVDPTGAGDAVAAGVLAAIGTENSAVDGCELGLWMAARRVADYGDRGHAGLHRAALAVDWLPTGAPRVQRNHSAWP